MTIRGKHGTMNVDFSESYDQESDTYYVTFKTGEPSIVQEVDDVILLEVGMFTNTPTGFRVLNFKENQVEKIAIVRRQVKKALQSARKSIATDFSAREAQVDEALERVFA